ncbi:MAG: SDR family oxidoreductase [Proteobacteria bacterium]|nr:SDR family oxidoreductase [Pseudomonadota bacterium]
MDLENNVAVITGGNSGIGLATAQRFHELGARVAIMARSREKAATAVASIGENAIGVVGDVTKTRDIEQLYATVADTWGQVDYVIANAAVADPRPLIACDEEYFDGMTGVNFRGVFFTVQKSLGHLRDGGAIVLVSSSMHYKGQVGFSVYAATKSAIRSLARSFARELAPRGIRVNCLSPGATQTPMFQKLGLTDEQMDQFHQFIHDTTPLMRISQPEEVARAIVFLCTEATYMTAADLVFDGGYSQV